MAVHLRPGVSFLPGARNAARLRTPVVGGEHRHLLNDLSDELLQHSPRGSLRIGACAAGGFREAANQGRGPADAYEAGLVWPAEEVSCVEAVVVLEVGLEVAPSLSDEASDRQASPRLTPYRVVSALVMRK